MLNRSVLAAIIAGFVLLSAGAGGAQVSRQEFEDLKADLEILQRQLQDLTQALRARGVAGPEAIRDAAIGVAGEASRGKKDARITIVEFSDYQCVFCGRHVRDTFSQIDREYIQTGRVRYVLRDFPIESIHPQALGAHEAALCAGAQGKRWEMHERLFANQRALTATDLIAHAQAIDLDMAGFRKCVANGTYSAKVRQSVEEAKKLRVIATPTFFLGVTEPNSPTVKAVRRIIGAQPYPVFKAAIEELLSAP